MRIFCCGNKEGNRENYHFSSELNDDILSLIIKRVKGYLYESDMAPLYEVVWNYKDSPFKKQLFSNSLTALSKIDL